MIETKRDLYLRLSEVPFVVPLLPGHGLWISYDSTLLNECRA